MGQGNRAFGPAAMENLETMAEESRIKAARKIRGILQGFPVADRGLIVQLATIEGAPSKGAVAEEGRRKPGPKPGTKRKASAKGNGHAAPAAGLKKDGTPRRKPGPRPKAGVEQAASTPEEETPSEESPSEEQEAGQ